MHVLRPADERGFSHAPTRDTRHAFASGDYHDARWTGWGALRVLNEETLAPGAGIAMQRYANMEVITHVLSGALRVRDELGEEILHAGDMHLLSAGRSIDQRLDNASATAPAILLRVWIQPDRVNAAPSSTSAASHADARDGRWSALASPDAACGSLRLQQHGWVRRAHFAANGQGTLDLASDRRYWLHVLGGDATVDGRRMQPGDAIGWRDASAQVAIAGGDRGGAVLMLIDLPG